MEKIICSKCRKVFDKLENGHCPSCSSEAPHVYDFKNSDDYLHEAVPKVLDWRKSSGLEGLVKGLDSIIINTEPDRQEAAVSELLGSSGLVLDSVFEDYEFKTFVLKTKDSADFLVRSRKKDNPFKKFNDFPKSKHLSNTRLETFVFETKNLEKYIEIQKDSGVEFLTNKIIQAENYSFIQTAPSEYTGNSIGFIQWTGKKGNYSNDVLDVKLEKPDSSYLKNIGRLDHTATRVKAKNRDASIIEFMKLTNYKFDFAVYVKLFNSITNVARLSSKDFAMVFTSGISPYVNDLDSGPTETFTNNYGPRVHHMAFDTEKIEDSFAGLKEDGMDFLLDLIGSHDEGLKQTFSVESENTLLVNEYIHRYDNFEGFFTKNNVTLLTESTEKQ